MAGLNIAKQRRRARMIMLSISIAILVLSTIIMFRAFENNLVYFVTPADLTSSEMPQDQRLRLGGLVAVNSVIFADDGVVNFDIEDGQASVSVVYNGILPDLFREGQGVVTEGQLGQNGVFIADTVLAKHDETYMPAEVAEALKEQGVWQGQGDE